MVLPEGEILSKVLDSLRTKVSDFNYRNWFQNLSWDFAETGCITVKVPSKFIRDWIKDHYLELIKYEFFRLTGTEHEIEFRIEKQQNRNLELFPNENKPQTAHSSPSTQGSVESKKTRIPTENEKENVRQRQTFNAKYSFDNFVVGNSNQFVHAACKAVALQPAKSYNPLFIYGGVGLGKTHLLNSIGLEIKRNYPNWRVIYTTGEQFTNEVINSIRYDKTYDLRKKFRDNCDILLIDDIQFIAGKERTMEEFFHTFNALYEARKQIILTSDQYPKNIDRLEERLQSRFSWGLLADIQPPDYETRIAILKKKAEEDGMIVPNDVAEFIASNSMTNVRDLEGALVRVFAFSSLTKLPVTLDLSREVLRDIVVGIKPTVTVESIQNRVAEFYQLKISELKSKRRYRNLAVPRQIAMYLCKKHLDVSFPAIGSKFGGKDHTTVMHAVQKITKCLDDNSLLQTEIVEIEKSLGV